MQKAKHSFIICLVVVLLATVGNAQPKTTIDSLNREAKRYLSTRFPKARKIAEQAHKQSEKADYTHGLIESTVTITKIQANTSECKEALRSLDALLPIAKEPADIIELYAGIGRIWAASGNYDSARTYHEKALSLCPANSTLTICAYGDIAAAKIYIKKGNNQKALEYYEKARAYFSKQKDKEGLGWTNDLLGDIYYAQRLYDKALSGYRQSQGDFQSINHRWGQATTSLHLGNIYYMQIKDDSSLANYTNALNSFAAVGDSNGMAICYSNLSRLSLEAGNTQQAIEYAHKALNCIRPGNYITIEAGTYQQLGDIYGETGDYIKAIEYVQQALQTARVADNKVMIKDCYKSLSEIYEAMHKPDLAMKNLRLAYLIKDSIQPVLFNQQLAEMEAKYETEKKATEIQLLKQKDQLQKSSLNKQAYILASLCIIIAVIIVATYFYITRRKLQEQVRRQNTIRETEEKERRRIAKDIHDELGSGLSKIRFLSELAHAQPAGSTQLSGPLNSIADTSRGLVENMRDLIWAMNPENTTLDNLVARIREYSHDYLEEFPIDLSLDIPEDVPNVKVSKEMNRNVSMIVKEVLQNIVKHASATSVSIKITLAPLFRLEIEDNGKGYDVTGASEGNGLKNIETRSRALNARLQMTSQKDKGSRIELEFRMNAVV